MQINGGTIGTAANLVFGLSGTTANVIQSRDGTSLSWPLAINPFIMVVTSVLERRHLDQISDYRQWNKWYKFLAFSNILLV